MKPHLEELAVDSLVQFHGVSVGEGVVIREMCVGMKLRVWESELGVYVWL